MKRSILSQVGAVTHVSCIERRVAKLPDAPFGQLSTGGLATLESLCLMLEAKPVRVMARCSSDSSEVFMHLSNGAQVQYYGAAGATAEEQSVWVEGPRGSLRREGAFIYWRKRGWPKFLPWRLSSSSRGARSADDSALSQAIRRSSEQGSMVTLNG